MTVELADIFNLQLAQQASLFNLTFMQGRKRSADGLMEFFIEIVKTMPVTTAIEVGAHEASFSRKIKNACPNLTARAYEANPYVHAHFMLEGKLKKCGVDYIHTAVGNYNGCASFNIYENIQGQPEEADSRRHSVLLRLDSPNAARYSVETPMATLDALCAGDPAGSSYALWIDAEGFGKQALEGAPLVLANTLAIYMELESEKKFEGQALDTELMGFLLDRNFIPIARDFQFRHQYNAIFVRKDVIAAVEHLWHRYFNKALRGSMQYSFQLDAVKLKQVPVKPAPMPRLRFGSNGELREAIGELPLLRPSAPDLDPAKTVVACHASDLDLAINFYGDKNSALPEFYVAALPEGAKYSPKASLHDFSALQNGMNVQLFFRQHKSPIATPFISLANALQKKGIAKFSIEAWSASQFWRRNTREVFSDADWDIVRNFVNTLADASSQYAYLALCRARMEAEPGYMPVAEYKQYFHPLVRAVPGDIICEGGCYEPVGRERENLACTTRDFHDALMGSGKLYAFDPDPATCDVLRREFAGGPHVEIVEEALWSRSGRLNMVGSASGVFISGEAAGDGVKCASIDDFFMDKGAPTLIKLDVEGAEPEVLAGAAETIKASLPKLMIAIYHGRRGKDWLTVPRMLMEAAYPYDYHCGHHTFWYNETFVYARPNIA